MPTFLSRQDLIKAKRWRTEAVETEAGSITVAAPTHAGSLRWLDAQKRQQEGAGTSADTSASMLLEACVAADGAPLFASMDAARAALETITTVSAGLILNAFARLQQPATPEGALGNSGAGPSAGSPSASAAS